MKTFALSLVACSVVTATAWADHGRYRRLDDYAFAAAASARDLRWEIHDHFCNVRHYPLLLRDAEMIFAQIQQVTSALWSELPDPVLCRRVEHARNAITDLSRRLDHCGFPSGPGCTLPTAAVQGNVLVPPAHGGLLGRVAVVRMLMSRIDASLCAIHNELTGGHLVPYQAYPAPAGGTVPGPTLPGRGLPSIPYGNYGSSTRFRASPTSHHAESDSVLTPRPARDVRGVGPTLELPLSGDRNRTIRLKF